MSSCEGELNTVPELIQYCREKWAYTGGDGVLNFIWHPVEGAAEEQSSFDAKERDFVCPLSLSSGDGTWHEGLLSKSRVPETLDEFGYRTSEGWVKYEMEIRPFNYLARHAGAIVASECRQALKPFLCDGVLTQSVPANWWLAYLWYHYGSSPRSEETLVSLKLENIIYLSLKALEHFQSAHEARHSSDFRSVNWFGCQYSFTTTQAACVEILWKNWEQETPVISEQACLDAAGGASNNTLRDIFDKGKHSAWQTMITKCQRKGTFRLSVPEEFADPQENVRKP